MADSRTIVWIVNPYDNLPMEGNRPQRYWLMARAFVRARYRVVYWTSDFSHATKKQRVFVSEVDDGIEVRMIPSLRYGKNICLQRIRSHRRLAKDWLELAQHEKHSPDVVVASVPPLGLCDAARSFAKSVNAMFVADIQDAWPETFERIVPRFVLSLLGLTQCARRIYCRADGISAVAMRYVELAQKYGSNCPSMVFGHCIEMLEVRHKDTRNNRTLRLVYVGNMSMSYDLATVVRAVAGRDEVMLDIAGNGPDRQRLISLAKGAPNIKFHDYLDASALKDLLANCDVGLVPMRPESCVGVPGKLADYAAAGLKIIESLGGETGGLVDRYNVGTHYKAGDQESLIKAIDAVRPMCGVSNPDEFAKQFDATNMMDGYVGWVDGLLRCRKDWGTTRGPHADPLMSGRGV